MTKQVDIYDQKAKSILFHKKFLSVYLKDLIPSLKEYSIEEIEKSFGDDKYNQEIITALENDYNEKFEQVRFDRLLLMEFKEDTFFLDIEIQNDCSHVENLNKRKEYYQALLLVLQKNRTFKNTHYQKLVPVKSLWICLNPSKSEQNSYYYFERKARIKAGNPKIRKEHEVLQEIITINLGDTPYKEIPGMYLLYTLMKENNKEEMMRIIQEEFHIDMDKDIEGGVKDMCNLGEALAERYYLKGISVGEEKGIEKGIERGIEKEKQEMIYELYKENATIEFICRIAKCSKDYVEIVLNKMNDESGEGHV